MARPKRQFSGEEEAMIANYALDGGKNNTIASALAIPVNTLTNRFSGLLKEYRAYRALKLRRNQTRLSLTNPQMAIFLGKNELNQTDKQVIAHEDRQGIRMNDAQKELVRQASNEYLRLASRGPKLAQEAG